MESTKIRNTELLKVSIEDLDETVIISNDPEIEKEQPVNILREKTFNKELSSLVNKIYENEKSSGPALTPQGSEDFTVRRKNLLNLEKEIYRLKHYDQLLMNTSAYNPFELNVDTFDEIDDLEDYIARGIYQADLGRFALMKYSFSESAYMTDIGNFEEFRMNNIVFGVKDSVFRDLSENSEGIILESHEISSNPFLAKKFTSPDVKEREEKSYYIVKISIFNTPLTSKNRPSGPDRINGFISPLLITELDPNRNHEVSEIYRKLKINLTIPLAIYSRRNRINLQTKEYSLEETLMMIDLFMKSSAETKFSCIILTISDSDIRENIFILKYLLTKFRKKISRDSLIMRISIGRVIIATTEQDIEEIKTILSGLSGDEFIKTDFIEQKNSGNTDFLISYFS